MMNNINVLDYKKIINKIYYQDSQKILIINFYNYLSAGNNILLYKMLFYDFIN